MTSDRSTPSTDGTSRRAGRAERIVGRLGRRGAGPTTIVLGGIHGNELLGVRASRRVFRRIRSECIPLRGEVVFLAGNLGALEADRRYVRSDLNRMWTPERVSDVRRRRASGETLEAEEREMGELLDAIDATLEGARGDAYFLDLHTSSAHGAPFATVGDTLRNRRFALKLPLPLILGLEEQLDGALLEYLNNRGLVTLGVEAGQHRAPSSLRNFEAVLWLALEATGQVDRARLPRRDDYVKLLRNAARGTPRVIEVRRRHEIEPSDDFRMEPGYTNFQPVRKGTVLAHDRGGRIRAAEDGLVLLPLYQGQGDDGFFLSREVAPFWMKVSAVLRRTGVPRLVPVLPGVRKHARREGVLTVDTRVARLFPLEIFHLLGFRKLRRHGSILVVSRRKHDLVPPPRYV